MTSKQFLPLKIDGKCVASDEELFGNMDMALARGYPEILYATPPHPQPVALVGSGPSASGQLDVIRKMKAAGTLIVAVKDAHDWLIANGVLPDFAVAIDPQAHRWTCFTNKRKAVHYLIASQCHPEMFNHLEGCKVTIWHPYITKGQKHPPKKMVIGGGTTSGLRAISLFYTMGYRHFALFGFDSCLENGTLRVNGDGVKEGDSIHEVRIDPEGETFYCNLAMMLQAEHFQDYFAAIPDANFYPYGHGLIQAIIKQREANAIELQGIAAQPNGTGERISFIHAMGPTQASYRYRAEIPANALGASLNDLSADILVFAKPQAQDLMPIARAKARGSRVVVDFCDDHFSWTHYAEALRMADVVTCPTEHMKERIKTFGRDAVVIPDPYEYPQVAPHCNGTNLLWFGHAVNRYSLERVIRDIAEYPLMVVSNFDGSVPWSKETMLSAFLSADIVILPATVDYKSNNRTLESIRQGCFVVAEEHPSIEGMPGIWIGNIKEGIEWARRNLSEANYRTLKAQQYVMEKYSPQTLASAWRNAIQRPTTSAAVPSTGTNG